MRFNADGSADPHAFVISRPNAPVLAVTAQLDGGLLFGGSFSSITAGSEPGNNHAYYFTSGKSGWLAAEAAAVKLGGHLAAINRLSENDFATNTLLPSAGLANFPVWIGFTDQGVEGLFAWTTGDPVTFTKWASGQPNNNGNEDYAALNWFQAFNATSPGAWADASNPGTTGFGGTSDGPYQGLIEVDPATAPPTTNHWVAGRDLATNELAGSGQELTNPNASVPQWSYGARATLTSGTLELNPFTSGEHYNGTDLEGWFRPPYTGVCVAGVNANQSLPSGIGMLREGEMKLHPPS